jgi:hypothetical protein
MQTADATVSINGAPDVPCAFNIEIAQIEVTSFGHSEPDMTWQILDAVGHFHAFDHDGELPTLAKRSTWTAYAEPDEDGGTGYDTTTYHCVICDAQVEPVWKYISHSHREFAPGRTDYRITVEAALPDGQFSVVVTTRDRLFFGIGQGRHGQVFCGPMSWRKR